MTISALKLPEHLVEIKNAPVLYSNLIGREGNFNEAGQRGFTIILSNAQAAELMEKGFNVKTIKEDNRQADYYGDGFTSLAISIRRDQSLDAIRLNGALIRYGWELPNLDYGFDMGFATHVNVKIQGVQWSMDAGGGRHGVKAYLENAQFTTMYDPEINDVSHMLSDEVRPL